MAVSAASDQERMDWKHLGIVLAVGTVPTAISFVFGWWWVGTLFLFATLLAALFAFPRELHPTVFSIYAVALIAWVSGSLIAARMAASDQPASRWDQIVPPLAGILIGLLAVFMFWVVVIHVVSRWLLSISDSLGVSHGEAFDFVASRLFDTHQYYWVIENGKRTVSNDKGMLSRFGGPGLLRIRPGNVVVLERGSETRIEGPGTVPLRRLEFLKEPIEGKGIIDLRPQGGGGDAENVRTLDGIPLHVVVGMGWQIEPKSVTDARPGTQFAGGDATSRILGAPEYPVYEAIIRKAVLNTGATGAPGMFPGGPINILRDVIGTYTLDQIFSLQDPKNPKPEQRTIYLIEEEVKKRFDPSGAGVVFRSFDIREIKIPADVEKQWIQSWQAPIARQLRVKEAEAEREALRVTSEGRVETLEKIESARLRARTNAIDGILTPILTQLGRFSDEDALRGLIRILQFLGNQVARDEDATVRYIEAMQSVIESEGSKTFIISPPTRSGEPSASLPPRTQSMLPAPRAGRARKEDLEGESEQEDEQ